VRKRMKVLCQERRGSGGWEGECGLGEERERERGKEREKKYLLSEREIKSKNGAKRERESLQYVRETEGDCFFHYLLFYLCTVVFQNAHENVCAGGA
jgi:hypothetical protein